MDSTLPRSFRWELVRSVAFQPCGNARELVFGPSADLTRSLDVFRRQMVHTPSDSALFRSELAWPFLLTAKVRASGAPIPGRLYGWGSSAIGHLLGNPRFATCAWFLLQR